MENNLYVCPKCKKALEISGKSYVCENNHCYDIAKSGYVNLLLVNKKNSLSPGDNKEMTVARDLVMQKGYYKALTSSILKLIPTGAQTIIDAGCGTGYTIGNIKNERQDIKSYGFDISKFAIETAAKRYKNVSFSVASSNELPVISEAADVIICAFAPVFIEEIYRCLKKDGIFIRVVPAKDHLYNLKQYLYSLARENEIDSEELKYFELINTLNVKGEFEGSGQDMHSLIQMTPYYYHTAAKDLEKLQNLERFTANQSFLVRVYKKMT